MLCVVHTVISSPAIPCSTMTRPYPWSNIASLLVYTYIVPSRGYYTPLGQIWQLIFSTTGIGVQRPSHSFMESCRRDIPQPPQFRFVCVSSLILDKIDWKIHPRGCCVTLLRQYYYQGVFVTWIPQPTGGRQAIIIVVIIWHLLRGDSDVNK